MCYDVRFPNFHLFTIPTMVKVDCDNLPICFPPSVVFTSEMTSATGLRTDFSNFLPSLLNGGEIGVWPKQFEIFCPSTSHWRETLDLSGYF